MAEKPTTSGWLPPAAPGGRPPPLFEPAPPEPEPEREPAEPDSVKAAWGTPAGRPAFQPSSSPPNTLATTSLVLGVAGLLLVIFAPLSLPFSAAAWITGAQARKRVKAGITDRGDPAARWAVALGIIGVVLGVLIVVAWIALVVSGVDLEELRRDLERARDG
jgi:hypothetical protein